MPHDCCFSGLDDHLGWRAGTFGQLAVPIAPICPGDQFTAAGLLQASPARALEDLGTLLLGDHALHLDQQFALRAVAKRILQKDHLRVELGELLDQEPLMGIIARQPVR